MRQYERTEQRHLNDGQRYRDYEYLADDTWTGANEHERPAPVVTRAAHDGGSQGERMRDKGQTDTVTNALPPDRYPFVSAILHPVRTIRRAIGGLFEKKNVAA